MKERNFDINKSGPNKVDMKLMNKDDGLIIEIRQCKHLKNIN